MFACSCPIIGGEEAQPLVLCTLLCYGLLLFLYQYQTPTRVTNTEMEL